MFPVSETSQRSGKINRPVINTVFDIHVTGLARMPGGLFASINHVAGWIAHNKVRFITVEYKHGRLLRRFQGIRGALRCDRRIWQALCSHEKMSRLPSVHPDVNLMNSLCEQHSS